MVRLFNNLCIFLICLLTFCDGYNITNNLEKIAFQDRFVKSLHNYLENKETKIVHQCKLDLIEYVKAASSPSWAWLMFDAGSKISSGILNGNWVDLGQFDECLNIKAEMTNKNTIAGKYCLGLIPVTLPQTLIPTNTKALKLPETPEIRMATSNGDPALAFATCLPDSCTTNDIQSLYSWLGIKIEFSDHLCHSKASQPKITGGDIAAMTFLSIILAIMFISTAYDVTLLYLNKKPLHPLLIAFSILSNGKKLISISKSTSQISCLHGIRVISMMWVMLAHRYTVENATPKQNLLDVVQWMKDDKNMFIMGATVSVDTFFLLSGFLVSYSVLTAMAKGIKFNIIMFYIHRYLRLTPIIAVIIIISATVIKHLGSGPLWNVLVTRAAPGCQEYWWSALLYVQNFVNPKNMCIGQSWYLSVDTQLFILSPLLLIPLKRWPKIGILATTTFLFGSIIACFLIAWFNELAGFILANTGPQLDNYILKYYYATHTRAGAWLIGILLGYIIYEIKQSKKRAPINKITAMILWPISLTILCACVYTGNNATDIEYEYDKVANSFYIALLRPGWAIGVSWVIFACVFGYGGPINWFLSLPIFQVLSKFTYSMYLIHGDLQLIISGQARTSSYFSNLNTFFIFWGDFAFTLATALIFTLAFESPIIIIEKVLFGTKKEKSAQNVAANDDISKSANIP